MCIITDENDIIVSISLIPGVNDIPKRFHVYFPVKDINGLNIGDNYTMK